VPPFLPSLGAIPFGPFNGIDYGTEVKASLPLSRTGINRVFAVFRLGGIPEARPQAKPSMRAQKRPSEPPSPFGPVGPTAFRIPDSSGIQLVFVVLA